MTDQFHFNDGAAYERQMGVWSRLAGDIFLDWLAPRPGMRWVDVGCGNGAFTQLIVDRCAPSEVQGFDPSKEQIAFARERPAARLAQFHLGDAMALPFSEPSFDAAIMALVIFFVPEPAVGVAEMARVVVPGGTVAAYAWDVFNGGLPAEPILVELTAMGQQPIRPPRPEASRMENLRKLWADAGLERLETREIVVQRSFADFEDFWATSLLSPLLSARLAGMSAGDVERLKNAVAGRLLPEADGRILCSGRANAIKGYRPS